MRDQTPSELSQVLSGLDASGGLELKVADRLLAQGIPWRLVAPYVLDHEWWSQQRPACSAGCRPSFCLRCWDATVCIQTHQGTVWIDPGPRAPAPVGLPAALWPDVIAVTHAHRDHTAMLGQYSDIFSDSPVIMSPNTWRLLDLSDAADLLMVTCLGHRTRRLEFDDAFAIGEMTIKLLPAGHLLGASMVDVRTPDAAALVTGDFALRDVGGIGGAVWPDETYDVVLIESTAAEPGSLPVMDTLTTRQPILNAVTEARLGGASRMIVPAQAKAQAQEVYAALVLAQQAGEFPDLDVRLAGLAFRVALEYYRAVGKRPGPWSIEPWEFDIDNQPANSILIWSGAGWNSDETEAPALSMPGSDGKQVLPGLPICTHAGWSERLAFALGVDCGAVAPYHGLSLSFQSALLDAGRAITRLSQQGEEWTLANP